MSSEKPLVHHVYDGIEEHDNVLPNWWLGILWGTIVFAAGYWLYYGSFSLGPDQLGEYKAEVAEVEARKGGGKGPVDEASLMALAADPAARQKGAETFAANCAACHGAKGEGTIGPNLTDGYWLHGQGAPTAIHTTITNGVLAKGMPAWGRTLGAERVAALTAHVLGLKGQNVPGKPPQGEKVP